MNKRFHQLLLIVFYSLYSAMGFSQDRHKIDSLQNEINKFEAHKKELGSKATPLMDSTKANILGNIGWEYLSNNNDTGMVYEQQSLTLSEKTGYTKGVGLFYGDMGAYTSNTKKYIDALKYLQNELIIGIELKDKKLMISTYNNLGITYTKLGNFKEALKNYSAALTTALETGDQKLIASAYTNLASVNHLHGNYDTALQYNLTALLLYQEQKDSIAIADCYFAIGSDHYEKGSYPEALNNFIAGLNIATEIGYKSGIADFENNIGIIDDIQGKFEDALKNYFSALEIEKKIESKDGMAKSYCHIGATYLHQSNYKDALTNELKGLALAQDVNDKNRQAWCCNFIGEIYFAQKDDAQALNYYTRSLKIVEELKQMDDVAYASIHIGLIYEQQGELMQALNYESKGLSLSFKTGSKDFTKESYQHLAEINAKLKNYQAAYENEVLFKQYYDTLYNQQNEKKLTGLQMQYDFDKKQDSIKAIETKQQDSLRTEQIRKDAIAQKEIQNQKNILYSMFGGLFLVVSFSGFVVRSLRVSRKQKKVIEKEKQRAEQSERYKQQFLANMSHEIRTPMNAVMGMTNLLLDKNPRSDQFNYLDGIKKSSDNLLHIINDILDLSKVEAGKIELEQINFSLRDVVKQVKQTLQHKAEEKGLRLLTHIDESVPDVLVGDPTRLIQVLINLAGNAIKFTEKGSVTIKIGKSSQENNIKFSIVDTGIGIPEEKLQSVFESFSQAHSSDTRKFGGTGLGLTISKQFVELMGGTIVIESEQGSGSTFSFEINLPIGSVEKLTQQKSGEIDGSILNGLRILLVEDNEYNRIVAIDTLKSKAQVEIDSATNGKEAVTLLEKNNYDIVLMDVQMPEMDGYEATRKIRTEFSSPKNKIPIIALTASVIRSDLDKCRAAGMNSYVSKPFNASQLISAIAEAAERKINSVSFSIVKENKSGEKSSAIDLTYLRNFCEGNEDRMKKYITMFLDAVPGFQQKIEKAIPENDLQEIARQVHAFRPKLMMMGMKDAQELAVKIEMQCVEKERAANMLNENLRELLRQVSISTTELRLL